MINTRRPSSQEWRYLLWPAAEADKVRAVDALGCLLVGW